MINDPYIEIIQKTRPLNLEESLVENSINKFLKTGSDKTFTYLVHEKKIEEADAWKLVEAIKKEFKSTYYVNALYAGIFLLLFGFISYILYYADGIGFWQLFFASIATYCFYKCTRGIVKAMSIK